MHDQGGLAVHESVGPDHSAAKRFADRLVAQAYAQERDSTRGARTSGTEMPASAGCRDRER